MARKLYEARGMILVWIVANFLGVAADGAVSLVPFLTSIRGMLVSSLLIGLPIGDVALFMTKNQIHVTRCGQGISWVGDNALQ